ncbi:hypothetical protein Cob_v005362 [Colletotrichum orbiculare MAFF 240422]|uniref:Uncharacterized protein n=1 Tax=Colletotrichum orbiculare (strain 104-T / ATCC 96160 / CBS 514.97 / LARS 414 / MAFF 240422) TaxID=1213857 RepID=A0A484FTB7_COLOR|nr:hypothetical protein Cob_v005362 [Colletotrichum orbiculare MAFF 240422]
MESHNSTKATPLSQIMAFETSLQDLPDSGLHPGTRNHAAPAYSPWTTAPLPLSELSFAQTTTTGSTNSDENHWDTIGPLIGGIAGVLVLIIVTVLLCIRSERKRDEWERERESLPVSWPAPRGADTESQASDPANSHPAGSLPAITYPNESERRYPGSWWVGSE